MAVGPRLVLKAMGRLRVSLNVTLTQVKTSLVALRLENGVTYALDANWNRKVSVDIDNLTAVTDGIDDIPAVLKADTNDDGDSRRCLSDSYS